MPETQDWAMAPAATIAGGVASGAVSARAVVTAALERIERIDPRVNSFTAVLAERALARADVIDAGLLASDTPKGAVSLRFPADTLDVLFPRLFAEA